MSAPLVWLLIVMAALIGVAAFLFHTFANRWSELADTLPIWSFVGLFVLAAMHYVGGMAPARAARLAGIIAVAVVLTIWLLALGVGADAAIPLNGSGQYAPALLALPVFSAFSWWRGNAAGPWVRAATAIFTAALTART